MKLGSSRGLTWNDESRRLFSQVVMYFFATDVKMLRVAATGNGVPGTGTGNGIKHNRSKIPELRRTTNSLMSRGCGANCGLAHCRQRIQKSWFYGNIPVVFITDHRSSISPYSRERNCLSHEHRHLSPFEQMATPHRWTHPDHEVSITWIFIGYANRHVRLSRRVEKATICLGIHVPSEYSNTLVHVAS